MGENNDKNSDRVNEIKYIKVGQSWVASASTIGTDYSYKHEIEWRSVIAFSILHLLALWGLGVVLTGGISFKGVIWSFALSAFALQSIGVGAHRYYTHKCFKARPLLRAILNLGQTTAGQYSMYNWCRDHRLHHRYSDTDADPHNSNRGFFFSHMGWFLMKKHPHVREFGKRIDMSDLEADWMVMFQKKVQKIYVSQSSRIRNASAMMAFDGVSDARDTDWFSAFALSAFALQSIGVGAHRYYTHKCFKARPLLRAILNLGQTTAGQYSMYNWCRDHRLHHRYSDTDADPHNSNRGFFFSHMGWFLMKKHPHVREFGKRIDMSDLEADWMVMFQKKYYVFLYISLAVLLPVWVPVHYFGDTWLNSFLFVYVTRYIYVLHVTASINSFAHIYGTKPYDQHVHPVESLFISLITMGEGWHNYHHVFPWDYKAAELHMHFNISASVIRFLERIGLAYDLKTVTPEMVKNRIIRTGDGTHFKLGNEEAKSAVTAIGPVHPFNPTYNVKYKTPVTILGAEGLPLFHENDVFNSPSS